MEKNIKNVTIIGGGNSAHVIIPILAKQGYNVTLLTRKPRKWKSTITLDYIDANNKLLKTIKGNIAKISDNYPEVINKSDLVLLCLPVHVYPEIVDRVCRCLKEDRNLVIGTIYGQGGFNWMVEKAMKEYHLTKIEYFAFGLIPFICRIKLYGHEAATYGSKQKNLVATSSDELYTKLSMSFLDDCCYNFFHEGKFYRAPNFISLTLSVDNQLIHPCRLYDLYKRHNGRWSSIDEIPYFYQDFTHSAADTMQLIDDDLDKVRNAVKAKYQTADYSLMLNYLDLEKYSYTFPITSIYDSFINSPTLQNIKTPVIKTPNGYEISKKSRFFTDDIFYGLCIFKSVAQYLEIETSYLDALLRWAEKTTGILILDKDNKLNKNLTSGSIFKYDFDKKDMLTK
ncbi:MAG: NAD/NADP octopine/nopaline dehydrogenase family protein [Bacilli bacterium]|nr:NAD/NADP octopine/nopaline dehydrogenase family protein [Bacilli bacterium]